jgi:N-acetylglucosaminyl-diphospho-decaprenol L-rhamnosyltransferase
MTVAPALRSEPLTSGVVPTVSAVVVLYNSAAVIADCLRSLETHARAGWLEVVVVDNASPDDSAAVVEREFPWVRLVRQPRNLGFAGGVNRGLRVARGGHFLLVNPDVITPPETIPGLLTYLQQHPGVGAAGPKILRPSGRAEVSASYRPTYGSEVIESLGLFVFRRWVPAWRPKALLDPPAGPVAVDVLSGCFLMFPRHVLDRVGEFDEDFFMYVEDIDWCVRVRDAGFEVHYVPMWPVVHERSQGGANQSLTPMDGEGNLELYFRKHRVPHSPAGLRWLRRVHYLLASVWLLYRAATGRAGALTEAHRAWKTVLVSFRSGRTTS